MEAVGKRQVELVSPEELRVGPPTKRRRLDVTGTTSVVSTGTLTVTNTVQKTGTPSTVAVVRVESPNRSASSTVKTLAKSCNVTAPSVSSIVASNALATDTSLVGDNVTDSPSPAASAAAVETKIAAQPLVNGGTALSSKSSSQQPTMTALAKPPQHMIFVDENGQVIDPELLQVSQAELGEPPFVNVSEQEDSAKSGPVDSMMVRIQPGPAVQGHIINGQFVQDVPAASADAPADGTTGSVVQIAQQLAEPAQEQQPVDTNGGNTLPETTQVVLQNGDMAEVVGTEQIMGQAQIYQTEDGLILVQNADGSIQVHGQSDQPVPLETVQALLTMEGDGQTQVVAETVDTTISTGWGPSCLLIT